MPHEFHTSRIVEFAETDMAGIVHFSNFFRWMEAAEHEFFRSFGVRLHQQGEGALLGYARVKAECEYHSPARYADALQMHLLVTHVGERSLGYAVHFFVQEGPAPRTVACGRLRVVCVSRQEGGALRPTPLPPEVRANLEVAPQAAQEAFEALGRSTR